MPPIMPRRAAVLALLCLGSAAPGRRLLLCGDSEAFLLGPHLARALRPAGWSIRTVARGGTSARQWRERGWARALAAAPADLVLVSLGVNCVPADRARLDLDVAAVDDALGADRAAWLVPPRLRPDLGYLRAALCAAGVPGLDASGLRVPLDPDGVHPAWAGLRAWAAWLAPRITGAPTRR